MGNCVTKHKKKKPRGRRKGNESEQGGSSDMTARQQSIVKSSTSAACTEETKTTTNSSSDEPRKQKELKHDVTSSSVRPLHGDEWGSSSSDRSSPLNPLTVHRDESGSSSCDISSPINPLPVQRNDWGSRSCDRSSSMSEETNEESTSEYATATTVFPSKDKRKATSQQDTKTILKDLTSRSLSIEKTYENAQSSAGLSMLQSQSNQKAAKKKTGVTSLSNHILTNTTLHESVDKTRLNFQQQISDPEICEETLNPNSNHCPTTETETHSNISVKKTCDASTSTHHQNLFDENPTGIADGLSYFDRNVPNVGNYSATFQSVFQNLLSISNSKASTGDLQKKEMKKTIRGFIAKCQSQPTFIVAIVILTHGGEGDILFGKDGERQYGAPVNLTFIKQTDVEEMFTEIEDKLKILIIQACRGNKDCEHTDYDCNADNIKRNLFVINMTSPDCLAYRSTKKGSFCLQEFAKTVKEKAKSHDLLSIFYLVQQNFRTKKLPNGKYQFPEMTIYDDIKLYLPIKA